MFDRLLKRKSKKAPERMASSLPEALLIKALRGRIDGLDFQRFTFEGQSIPGCYCERARLAVLIDVHSSAGAPTLGGLAAQGIEIMHVDSHDVLNNVDTVVGRVTAHARTRVAGQV